MQKKIYRNRKLFLVAGILIAILGGLMGYFTYENEPWETISGAICAIGFVLAYVSLTVKISTE